MRLVQVLSKCKVCGKKQFLKPTALWCWCEKCKAILAKPVYFEKTQEIFGRTTNKLQLISLHLSKSQNEIEKLKVNLVYGRGSDDIPPVILSREFYAHNPLALESVRVREEVM